MTEFFEQNGKNVKVFYLKTPWILQANFLFYIFRGVTSLIFSAGLEAQSLLQWNIYKVVPLLLLLLLSTSL